MRRDWSEIVHRLVSQQVAVNIITNGFMFSERLTDELKSSGIESVSVSLDGPKQVHDKYRQEGSYDRAIRAIEVLADNAIPVSVISTLNSENVELLPELLDILISYPIYAWQLQACSPMGNAANNGIPYAFDQARVIRFVEDNMRSVPFALGIADNIGYFTPSEGTVRGDMSGRGFFSGCSAGLTAIGIDSIGNVRGCESMYDECFIEGNLRDKSLREIWENPDGFSYNRKFTSDLLTGACKTCMYGEYCAGGCRSYNHFVHGKMYEAPGCARNQPTPAMPINSSIC